MSYNIHGTCSLCGGAVTTPFAWWGVIPPTPTCSSCGAIPAAPHGPVIPMQPRRVVTTTTGTSVPIMRDGFTTETGVDMPGPVISIQPRRTITSTSALPKIVQDAVDEYAAARGKISPRHGKTTAHAPWLCAALGIPVKQVWPDQGEQA